MEPWYKVAEARKEVREGRSFNPDEFAIQMEQVVAGTAPKDYRDPEKFFSRTCFTRALREHAGMVLRRLAGKTENTAPVLTLITQFGGGKTHTLTALYHLARAGEKAAKYPGVAGLLDDAGLKGVPEAKVGVFVGNAWDPQDGRETPWIDVARQIAGEKGVAALGSAAKTTPPGTESLARLFETAGGRVLLLFDEVLNFMNRHAKMADAFYAFFDNINRATTGTTHCVAVMSLPRSQVEMTEGDLRWQDKIVKVVRRVAKDLIANDEAEISEVVRLRLFEDLGNERVRKNVAKAYADWCFERRNQLPSEWTAVDSAATEAKSREHLRNRFEACYPFHPATLSVFQRKWQALPQYQQTRGTLAMLAQWISLAGKEAFRNARREPLITLGSAPLDVPEFRSVVLGQLGEARLVAAIEADISGDQSHARALDADTDGPLKNIHRRVASAILFESSGGQVDKVAHLPELRFALGEPEVDTTSIDNAAMTLEAKAFFLRKVGTDGFQIRHIPTLKKVVSDRRASLDPESEVKPTMRTIVQGEFKSGASISVVPFPKDPTDIAESPRLTLIAVDPESEWDDGSDLRARIADWTRTRGKSPRKYPGALLWCVKKTGRELREKVEVWLAWKRVESDISQGLLGTDFDRSERADIRSKVEDALTAAKDEVWGGYRFLVLADAKETDGLKSIDLGAGHSSGETLCGRVISALKSNALLNEGIGSSYIERNWPEALKASGAWPLTGLRQSILNGALTRLVDPDATLRAKIPEFVREGKLGLSSGPKSDGSYERVWFNEGVAPEDVNFDEGVFLLTKAKAEALKRGEVAPVGQKPEDKPDKKKEGTRPIKPLPPEPGKTTVTLRIAGDIPPEVWNRLGTKVIPKLRSGSDLRVGVDFSVTLPSDAAQATREDLLQILTELGLGDRVRIE